MTSIPGEHRVVLATSLGVLVGLATFAASVTVAGDDPRVAIDGPPLAAAGGLLIAWLVLAAYGLWLRRHVRLRMVGLLDHRLAGLDTPGHRHGEDDDPALAHLHRQRLELAIGGVRP